MGARPLTTVHARPARRASLLVSGRQAALAALDHAMRELQDGRGGVLIFEGAPGSGRTGLLDVACEAAEATEIPHVRAGMGRALSLYGLARRGQRDGDGDRPPPGILVCIDDVDLCDAATRRAAALAPGAFGDTALLWVVAGTPGARGLEAHPDGVRWRIGELSRGDVDVLARRAAGGAEIEAGLRCALESIPRLPRHVVEAARRAPSPGDPRWPASLVSLLDPESRRLLVAATTLGPRFAPDDLAEVVGRPVGALVGPLVAALEAGVLLDDGDDLVFAHRLVRDLLSSTEADEDVVVRAVTTLARTGASEKLVLSLGRVDTHRLTPDVLRELSHTAARSDLRMAADLARQERDQLNADPEAFPRTRREDAAARVVTYSVQAGDPEVARSLAASHVLGEDHSPVVAFALAEVLLGSRAATALAVAERASRLPMTPLERVRLAAVRLACRAYADLCDPDEIAEVSGLVEDTGDARAEALVGLARALDTSAGGDLVEALRFAAQASEVPNDHSHGPEWWIARIFRAKLLADLGRLEESVHVLDSAAALAERRSQIGAIPNLLMVRATCEMEAGRLTGAAATLRAARRLAHAIGRKDLVETNAVNMLVRIAHLRGDTEGLAEFRPVLEQQLAVDTGRSTSAAIGLLFTVDVTSAAEVEEWARLSEKLDGPRRYAIARGLTDEIPRLRILLRHGLGPQAARLGELISGLASATDAALPRAAALHADGARHRRADALRAARAAYRDLERPMLAAQASEDLADVSDVPVERAEALREARTLWFTCGAHRETARIDKLLRSSGRRAPRVAEPQLGLGLTVSEERVVREVVIGRTNSAIAEALFLSPRTAGVHLRRIYAKTGVHNRAELVELVRSRP